ncbi:MAG: hydrolase [Gammaproteobacteria bacterium]|nr:hydrolase [Gammaproteobacteria bacterium]
MITVGEKPIKARFSINILENNKNEILLLKRHPNAELGPGLWGFPAGHIKEGESPEHCALRELHEEIGKDINIHLLKQFGPVRDSFYGGIYQIFLFHYRWHGGNIILNPEHTDYMWVRQEDYKNYAVMDGMDEDLYYLEIWPRQYLDEDKLPPAYK